MSTADLIAIGVILLLAVRGLRRGLVIGAFSLAGLVGGAVLGARLAPALMDDVATRYQPLVALGGALVLATVGQACGALIGRWLRGALSLAPLRTLDSAGGLLLGGLTGVALCWAVGAILLYAPEQTELRRYVQESTILSTLNREVPPERVMGALSRIDALAAIAGPAANVAAPDPAILDDSDVTIARESVVRIRGYACGLGIEGSGWVAATGVVVTNAHVVAGVDRPVVDQRRGPTYTARVTAFDATNDVAVLSVPGLRVLALELAPPEAGVAAAMLGYPENGPYTATPMRLGRTISLVGRDAYGRFPTVRKVTSVRGKVREGNSGGPVVDDQGRVLTTVFGGRSGPGRPGGYGVPNDAVRAALQKAAAGRPQTTDCVER